MRLALLAAAFLLALPVLTLPAAGGGHEGERDLDDRRQGHGQGAPAQDLRQEAWDRLEPLQKVKGMEKAERHGLFSRFAHDPATGMATGRFASFHIVEGTAAIHRLDVHDGDRTIRFLESVEADGANGGSVVVMGAILRDDASAVELTAHNNPTGGMVWKARANITLSFRLGEGALVADRADPREVRFVVGTPHAHLLTNGAGFEVEGNESVTVALQAGEMAAFRAHPSRGGDTLHQENALLTTGKLGAQLRIAGAEGAATEDGTELDVRATTREIARGRVVLNVSSDQHEGRVVVVTVDSDTLDPNATISASLNGTAMERTDAAGLRPGAFAVVPASTGMSTTVMVYVPSFSSYALAITADGGGARAGTSGAPGTSFALAAGALAIAALAMRRRA